MVSFTVLFICLLVVRTYVCKCFRQAVGWGYVWYWVCLFVGWWLCLNSRDGVSVGLFHYKFKGIPWIFSYKWADYWPYWELI